MITTPVAISLYHSYVFENRSQIHLHVGYWLRLISLEYQCCFESYLTDFAFSALVILPGSATSGLSSNGWFFF
jgi:hypothetical protein